MVVTPRVLAVLQWVGALARRAYPHAVGLAGLALIVAGLWGWLGWPAGAIAGGLPFAGFWAFGEYLSAVRSWRQET